MTDDIAERARKLGVTTLHSTGEIAQNQRLKDNDEPFVNLLDMLNELCQDIQQLTRFMRDAHGTCDRHNDVATTSLLETGSIRRSAARGFYLRSHDAN
jgi:starvation-inducible DNA-binding protein